MGLCDRARHYTQQPGTTHSDTANETASGAHRRAPLCAVSQHVSVSIRSWLRAGAPQRSAPSGHQSSGTTMQKLPTLHDHMLLPSRQSAHAVSHVTRSHKPSAVHSSLSSVQFVKHALLLRPRPPLTVATQALVQQITQYHNPSSFVLSPISHTRCTTLF